MIRRSFTATAVHVIIVEEAVVRRRRG